MKLLEHEVKVFLSERGVPVPDGRAVSSADEAREVAAALGGKVVVKALVAAGRRGKAGGVRVVESPAAAADATAAILGTEVAGRRVDAVYIEPAVPIREELYLSFSYGTIKPQMVVSRAGGVDIEQTARERPDAVTQRTIDPIHGLTSWQAAAAWEEAGADSATIPALAALTIQLFEAFRNGDCLMLELNPIAVTESGALVVVGTMAEVDDNALFRHPQWEARGWEEAGPGGRPLNARERAVIEANRIFPGASVRYTELDGDIGLMVSGGGAGLLQHDLVLAAGGSPSCHTDLSPTPTADKPAALIEAIISNPATRGLLVGFNYLQLAACDRIVEALLMALDRCGKDPLEFPIVLRLFGPREVEARQLAAQRPGMTYLPADATLSEGVQAIVDAVRRVRERDADRSGR